MVCSRASAADHIIFKEKKMYPIRYIFPIVDKLLFVHSKKIQPITPKHSGTHRYLYSCAGSLSSITGANREIKLWTLQSIRCKEQLCRHGA